jgi:similar to spore coat protein
VIELIQRTKITPHEAMELHELITFKNLCATKSASMSALVKDEELKSMMQQDLTMGQEHITELQNLMQKAARSSIDAPSMGTSPTVTSTTVTSSSWDSNL